jgi:2-(1,2-epoxy-1,2-dihydrophenyl)acetyl-CoA isomerase
MDVLYEERDGVAEITLNRPQVFNSIDSALAAQLREALGRAESEARAVLLTGADRAFCAGADLKSLEAGYVSGEAPALGRMIEADFNPVIRDLVGLPLPVIAAVNGAAAGAGVGLALAADLRIASSRASFTMAFVKVGLVPDSGTSWTLARAVGQSRALELAMSGRQVKADEALAIGLVHRVAEPDALLDEARAWAVEYAAGPTLAYAATKRLLLDASAATFEAALHAEGPEQDRMGRTADHLEGVRAFLERRPAVYSGK